MRRFPVFILFFFTVSAVFFSCKNKSSDAEQPPQITYANPARQTLKVSIKKLDRSKIKTIKVHPQVKKFDLDKLPVSSYDSTGFKPLKYPIEKTKINLDGLRENDLDIDKLPSRPLKFSTQQLPPPKLIKSGLPHLKNATQFLYQLGIQEGLEGSYVTGVMTDRDGFIWIASSKGVYRYDGSNLLFYLPVNNYHFIVSMKQDTAGRIWMLSVYKGGLAILDTKEGTLKTPAISAGLADQDLVGMIFDRQQRVWISTYSPNGVAIIDPQRQTVKWLDKTHHLSDRYSTGVAQDDKHHIWISTYKGLNIIDPDRKKIKYFNRSAGLKSDTVDYLAFDRTTGNLWLSLKDGLLNVIDFKKGSVETIKDFRRPGESMQNFFQDKAGTIWIGTSKQGLVTIDRKNSTAKKINNENGLADNSVGSMDQDSTGQLWMTVFTGLNMISNNPAIIEKIGNTRIDVITEDAQGLVWELGFNHGLDIIDRKNKTSRHLGIREGLLGDTANQVAESGAKMYIATATGIEIIDRQRKTITKIGKAEGYSGKPNCITVDKKGRVWIGERYGLDIFDPAANRVMLLGKTNGFDDGEVDVMQTDEKGRVWMSTAVGRADIIDIDALTISKTNSGFVSAVGGGTFLQDKNGNMWMGSDHGLYIFSAGGTLTRFSVQQGLIDDRVASLAQRGNQIYVTTLGGLSIITPPDGLAVDKKWRVKSFGRNYGLTKTNPNYALTDALSSDGKLLWGDYGITVFDPDKAHFSQPPVYISGLNIMDQPGIFNGRAYTVSNGHSWDGLSGPFNLPVNLQLPHDQNYVQFNFTTLNFRMRDTAWYSYRLNGRDTGWSKRTPLDHSNIYFNLAPGAYTLEVVSRTSESEWSKPATFSFNINPAWWETWWAYVLYVALFAGIVWGFATYRSRQLVKEKRVLEHKVQVRTEEVIQQKEEIEAQRDNLEISFKELKNAQTQLIQSEKMASLGELTAGIAHEIQNPLNFVNNFAEVNQEMIDELEEELNAGNIEEALAIAADIKLNEQKINHHGRRADGIVKGMLQHSRTAGGEKQPTNINAVAEEYMRLSYHGLRAKDKGFNAEMVMHFDPDLPKIMAVGQDIGRVLLNLFNNAFYAVNLKKKTAASGYNPEVSVTTTMEGNHVIIEIKDNGAGIPDDIKEKIMQPFFTTKPTGEGTGLGLSLTYDMVVKGHGGSIQVNSIEGEGSAFIIHLPLI